MSYRRELQRRARNGLRLVLVLAALIHASATENTGQSLVPLTHAQKSVSAIKTNPQREAYYGDLHLHTNYSLDAYVAFGAGVDPNDAYRFAKGETVNYLGQPVRRREPLDFMAVTDHSEYIGVLKQLEDPNSSFARSELGKALVRYMASRTGRNGPTTNAEIATFARKKADVKSMSPLVKDFFKGWLTGKNDLPDNLKAESAWQREIQFANRNYEPGRFTTFIAYEWSSQPNAAVLHRNVIFKGDSAPPPFTARDSQRPEDLWEWLNKIRKEGYEALAIPHNGNFSTGLMYDWVDSNGKPIDEVYAEKRQLNEPLSEISQNKGASETHPLLSPNDEFSNYEILERIIGASPSRPAGSYLRNALGRGLVLDRKLAVNPFKYGFVGASDLHSGLSISAQADFAGGHAGVNLGGVKPTKEQAAAVLSKPGAIGSESSLRNLTSGNLTGVWAESNTRESIYGALRRRETFATTGTKIKLRFFGGWNYAKELLDQGDWLANAYRQGVPMGGDLAAKPSTAEAPSFAIWAVKDPNGANLDRVQVIKVWEEDGRQKEKVFDVVWSGPRKPFAETGKLPAVGNTVNQKTGTYTNTIGAAELKTVWKDPEFTSSHFAAYYLRVLEIPTPRWSTLLAVQYGLPIPKDVATTIQLRGWSSPIWYSPHRQSNKKSLVR
jgi:hypothetical protein